MTNGKESRKIPQQVVQIRMCWADTPSPPRLPAAACGRCATLTQRVRKTEKPGCRGHVVWASLTNGVSAPRWHGAIVREVQFMVQRGAADAEVPGNNIATQEPNAQS